MTKKLSASLRRKIIRQWSDEFPTLKIHRSMSLFRRVGPLLEGITLDRDSSNFRYLPVFHIHNLATELDYITLTLRTPLLSGPHNQPEWVSISHHEKNHMDVINRFCSQIPLSLNGDLHCDEVIGAYKEYINKGQVAEEYPLEIYFDIICVLVWCERIDEARSLYDIHRQEIDGWPAKVTKYIEDRTEKFLSLENWLSDPELIKSAIERTETLLKILELPNYKLLK